MLLLCSASCKYGIIFFTYMYIFIYPNWSSSVSWLRFVLSLWSSLSSAWYLTTNQSLVSSAELDIYLFTAFLRSLMTMFSMFYHVWLPCFQEQIRQTMAVMPPGRIWAGWPPEVLCRQLFSCFVNTVRPSIASLHAK